MTRATVHLKRPFTSPCVLLANWALLAKGQIGPSWCWFPGEWAYAHSRLLWVSPTNSPMRLEVSPAATSTPMVFSIWGLRLYFPMLEPWIAWFVSLPGCSSRFIYTRLWHCPLYNLPPCSVLWPPPCHKSSPSDCPSPPLLQVWMNVSSSPWLSVFHTVRFSVSSCCFLFLNCCCPSFGCARRHSVSTYASILAGSHFKNLYL